MLFAFMCLAIILETRSLLELQYVERLQDLPRFTQQTLIVKIKQNRDLLKSSRIRSCGKFPLKCGYRELKASSIVIKHMCAI